MRDNLFSATSLKYNLCFHLANTSQSKKIPDFFFAHKRANSSSLLNKAVEIFRNKNKFKKNYNFEHFMARKRFVNDILHENADRKLSIWKTELKTRIFLVKQRTFLLRF